MLGTLVLPVALVSIVSGILLFLLMLFISIQDAVTALDIRTGIPFVYAYLPQTSFDWFYLPTTMYLLLTVIVVLVSLSFIVLGQRISNSRSAVLRR